jgi:hypothetical protein
MTVNLTPPPERDFPAPRLEQRREQLVSRIEAEGPRAPRPLYRRRWAVAAIALAVAGTAAALALTLLSPGQEGLSSAGQYIRRLPRVSTSVQGGHRLASMVLLRTARTAAGRKTTAPGPGDFIYTKSESVWETIVGGRDGPAAIAFQSHAMETWNRPDGSGHYTDSEGHMVFPTEADAAYFYANDPLRLIDAHDGVQYYPAGPPNYDDVSQLPTDPAQLKQVLDSRTIEGGPPGDFETFQIIGDLLRGTDAPPDVRSALYTVASQLPGVVLLGTTQDQLGRPGIGVAYDSGGTRYELIFDPQTSGLLAEQTIVLDTSKYEPFSPGTLTGWTAYIATGIVGSDSATTSATP